MFCWSGEAVLKVGLDDVGLVVDIDTLDGISLDHIGLEPVVHVQIRIHIGREDEEGAWTI
jgi:hypothetical protein